MATTRRRKSGYTKRVGHSPSLKKSMKSKGVRLVHGYETVRRKKTKKR